MDKDRGIALGLVASKGERSSSQVNRPRGGRRAVELVLYLIRGVAEWGAQRTEDVVGFYLDMTPEGLVLYAVGRKEAFDFTLSEAFSRFSSRYIEEGLLTQATLLPATSSEELTSFFDPERALFFSVTR
jgi:hypothetical protein